MWEKNIFELKFVLERLILSLKSFCISSDLVTGRMQTGKLGGAALNHTGFSAGCVDTGTAAG